MKITGIITITTYCLIISHFASSQFNEPLFTGNKIFKENKAPSSQNLSDTCGAPVSRDFTYIIENIPVTLINGISETESAPGSAAKSITRCSGDEAIADLNSDCKKDAAFILIRNTGGSGTFYYMAVIISSAKEYKGTNAIYIGDRIIVNSIVAKGGTITVNYLGRKKDDPMSAMPTVHVSKQIKIKGGQLFEVSTKE